MSKSRILSLDLETAPNTGFSWGKWEQNIIRFKEEWYILCFAYKWLGEKKVHTVSLPDFRGYKNNPTNDRNLVKKLHELFSEADVLIAHNGDAFDIKKANARFTFHGFNPPAPYRTLDTRKIARKYFSFNSNKLDDLGEHLKLGRKEHTGGFDLWMGCMSGDMKSWKKMLKYNKQDVVLLEKIYLRMRPWITNHPAMNLMDNVPDSCPNCGKGPLTKNGTYYNRVTKVQVWQCQNCGANPRSRIVDAVREHVSFV